MSTYAEKGHPEADVESEERVLMTRNQKIEVRKQVAKRFQQSLIACRILRKQLPRKEIPNATRAVRKDGCFAIFLGCERDGREEMTWKFKMLAEPIARITIPNLTDI